MIDNNTNNNEFDKLVEELLAANQNEETDEISSEEMITSSIDGKKYLVPDSISPSTYIFHSAELILDGTDIMEKATNFKTCLHEYSFKTAFYLYISQTEKTESGNTEHVRVFLYKKGRRKPLAQKTCVPDENGIYFDMSELVDDLRPGDYFILLNNLEPDNADTRFIRTGNNFRFCFTLLPDGEKITHPDIRSMQIAHDMAGTSGKLVFSISLSRFLNKTDEWSVCCYNSSFTLMDKAFQSKDTGSPRKREITFILDSPNIWTADRYFCLIAHNGEPFYKAAFELGLDGPTNCCGETIRKNSQDYALMKYLERHPRYRLYWIKLRKTPGYSLVKQKLMECFRENVVNILRENCELSPIKRSANFICIGEESKQTESVINDFAFVIFPTRTFQYVDAESLAEPKNMPDPYADIEDTLSNAMKGITCFTNIGPLLNENGRVFFRKLEKQMQKGKNESIFIRATASEVSQLFDIYPSLKRFFPEDNRLILNGYTPSDAAHSLQRLLQSLQLSLSKTAEKRLSDLLEEMARKEAFRHWGKEQAEHFLQNSILPNYRKRILETELTDNDSARQQLSVIEAEDIRYEELSDNRPSYETCIKKLNEMVGLDNVKEHLNDLFNQSRFNNLRRQMGFRPQEKCTHHLVFTGNPGTGKTTVARMIGSIYRSLGLLSKGDVIVTERKRLVGQYIGETEKNMQAILNQARGNVLFIDEAYTLTAARDGKKDFGHRVIESLLTVLSQPDPDMIVILAGYQKEMEQMLETNPGLQGRFPHILHFNDYSADELMQIALHLIEKEEYELSENAHEYLYATIREASAEKTKDFSNARWIEQYIHNGILPAMAGRVLGCCLPADRETYRRIEKEDIVKAYIHFKLRRIETESIRKIGFRA